MPDKKNRFKLPDVHAYVESLKSPWQTMQQDVAEALAIIATETNRPLSQIKFIDKVERQGDAMVFSFPDWHAPVEQYFIQQYGEEQGRHIFEKVVIQLFRRARDTSLTIH